MHSIARFSLEQHAGDYASWPARSRLFQDGEPTALELDGYRIFRQFELDQGFLLVVDYDCPFEEVYQVYLLSAELQVISQASDPPGWSQAVGVALGAVEHPSRNLYCGHEVVDPRCVRLLGCTTPPHLEVRVRERRPLLVGSRLQLRWVGQQ
jgi:hypothetical protein